MSDAIDLKNCPLCGDKPELQETEGCDFVILCACGLSIFDDMTWDKEDYNSKDNVINKWNKRIGQKDSTSTEKSIVNEPVLAPRYFVVGYIGTQLAGTTTGTINIWGDNNYLSRAKATKIVEENNEGIKDVVITNVNELNEKDFEAWRGNGG